MRAEGVEASGPALGEGGQLSTALPALMLSKKAAGVIIPRPRWGRNGVVFLDEGVDDDLGLEHRAESSRR